MLYLFPFQISYACLWWIGTTVSDTTAPSLHNVLITEFCHILEMSEIIEDYINYASEVR